MYRLIFDVKTAKASNPVRVVKGPVGPSMILPELTAAGGIAVPPTTFADGTIAVTEN